MAISFFIFKGALNLIATSSKTNLAPY